MARNQEHITLDRLDHLCVLVTDGTHDSPRLQPNGIPFIKGKHISSGFVDFDNCDYITLEEHIKAIQRSKPEHGDILFSNIGSVGDAAYINTRNEFSIKNVALFKPNPRVVDSKYLYYVVIGPKFKGELFAKRSGVAQPFFSLEMLRNHEVEYHRKLTTQRKIASILSAYDDLIENNQRRIKILEEMAQNLYREWFVKFRFPGYQHARFIASSLGRIPEGWEVREMQDIAEVIDCLHSKKPQRNELGTGLLLQLRNIGDGGKIDLSDKFLITDDDYQKWTIRIEIQSGDCVVTNVGRVGAVAQIPVGLKAAIGRNMTAVRPFAVGPTYLIEYLLSPHMIKEVQIKKDGGAIMDSLNVKGIVKLLVPVGPLPLMDLFEDYARPMRALVERLFEKNSTLRRTRDLLLPKLISGEVDVSELDIDIGNLIVQARAEFPAIRSADTTSKKKVKIETAPLSQPKKESSVKTPETKTPDKIPAPIDEWETNEVMAVFRSFARGKGFIEREQFIRLVAYEMGYKRVSSRIYSILKGHIIAAIRRDILETESGWVRIKTSTIEEYHPNDLIRALWSVLPKNRYSGREDTMRAAAEHLGFRRLTEKARMNIKAAMRVAIRKGILKGDKEDIWRAD